MQPVNDGIYFFAGGLVALAAVADSRRTAGSLSGSGALGSEKLHVTFENHSEVPLDAGSKLMARLGKGRRVHFPSDTLEVLNRCRAAVGGDYCLGLRLLGDEVIDGGSRIEDATYYSVEFARAGADFILTYGAKEIARAAG